MDPRHDHEDWDALAVGWAMSALDREDEERFAAHLPGCARCTATVRESLYTVADLAYALPDEAPPASMKARLMAAVAAEPRRSPTEPEQPSTEPSTDPEAESTGPEAEWPRLPAPAGNLDWFAGPDLAGGDLAGGDLAGGDLAGGDRAGSDPAGPDLAGDESPGDPPAQPRVGDGSGNGATPEPDRLTRDDGPVADPPGNGATPEPDRLTAADHPVLGDRPGTAGRPALGDRPTPPGQPGVGGRTTSDSVPPGEDGVVVPLEPRRRRRRITLAVAAAAVLALVAGLGVWNVQLRSDQDDLRRLVAQRDAAIQQLTASGPARVAALTGNGQPSPERRATLVVRGDQVEIIVETLVPTTGNERYWLWTLRCDTPQPTDLKPIKGFTVTQPEFSVRDIGSDPGVATATCFAISSEVGSATPTTPRQVVAVGQPE
jgi:hypothetical protein